MNLVPQVLTRAVSRKVLLAKKNSPHIFFVGGVVGIGVSTVLACKATLSLEKEIDDIRQQIEDVKENAKTRDRSYGEQEYRKDLLYVYARSAKTVGRLYFPSIAIGVVSVAALTGSHVQLTRRNTALSASLAGLMKAYDEYREKVREELGEERELEIYRGVTEETRTIDGKKEKIKVLDPNGHSPHARLFDHTSSMWKRDAEYNRMFIEHQQRYHNHLLNARGHVFLQEVYDALGLPRCPEGQIVGWVRNSEGDGYIDFGMYEVHNDDFVISGSPFNIWLDFNVDGIIYDKI